MVIPLLNDAEALASLLAQLDGADCELIVADGGSTDSGVAIARAAGAVLVRASRGRGYQLAAGTAASQGRYLWLLHADTRLDAPVCKYLTAIRGGGAGDRAGVCNGGDGTCWGRFDIRLNGNGLWLRLIGRLMNWRSRQTGICTGDHGVFVGRRLLERAGGVPLQPLMEDIELSKRLKAFCPPRSVGLVLATSARRWQEHGILPTILNMWWLRFRYWAGADPRQLARDYYG